MRPDVVMYANGLPATIIDENSLCKLSYVLLTQLRFLRNCNRKILTVEGFCFPKDKEASCACQITVTWNCKEFVFDVAYSTLDSTSVRQAVIDVYCYIKTQTSSLSEIPDKFHD